MLVVSKCHVIIYVSMFWFCLSFFLLILDQDLNSSSTPTSCLAWNNANDRGPISQWSKVFLCTENCLSVIPIHQLCNNNV